MRRRPFITSAATAMAAVSQSRLARPAVPPSMAGPVDLLLVLAVDVSNSINDREARLQREGYRAAVVDPTVLAAVHSGTHGAIGILYVEWAGSGFQRLRVPWTRIVDDADADTWAARLAAPAMSPADAATASGALYSGTSIAHGIAYSVAMLARAPWEADRRVIDVSGDGVDNSYETFSEGVIAVEWTRDRAIQEGITVNGLAIQTGDQEAQHALWPGARLADYYSAYVAGGPGAFVVDANDITAFRDAVRRKLVREISAPSPASALA